MNKQILTESMIERVSRVIDELVMAIQSQRPCIILLVYRSELIFDQLQCELEQALSSFDQSTRQIRITSSYNDIPLILAESNNRDDTTFIVTGLCWGGGKGRKNAYKALNFHREYLIDQPVRAIFGLTPKEAKSLPRYAPDFWAFRHRFFEFLELPAVDDIQIYANDILIGKWSSFVGIQDVNQRIQLYEKRLSDLPYGSVSIRLEAEYHETLGALLWANGDYCEAIQHLEKGLSIAYDIDDRHAQMEYLTFLGIIHQSIKDYIEAVAAYKRVIEMNSKDFLVWSNLASTYLAMGLFGEAIEAVNNSITSNYENPEGWLVKGNIFYNLGCYEDAVMAYRRVIRLSQGDIRAKRYLGEIFLKWGNSKLASRYFS